MKAWEGVLESMTPERSVKPRKVGLTMVIDKGLGLAQTQDLMDTAADVIDFVKMTFGTAAFLDYDFVKRKAAIVTTAGVDIYPGGTFLEIAVYQKQVNEYLDRCLELGLTAVEISDGTLDVPLDQRAEIIKAARDKGLKVITEVGKKDPNQKVAFELMHETIRSDLALGAAEVIVEARESGRGVGIYDASGAVDSEEVDQIVAGVDDITRLMWEAPLKNQQLYLIRRFGPNVSFGNIPPADILAMEALRCAMRGDTLKDYVNSH
jgi:phosphosulfolactate synthase